MRRNEWTFDHGAAELLAAAQARVDHHHARRSHWEAEKLKGLDQIRAAGLEISEGFMLDLGTSNTLPSRGPEVQINADLKRHVSECHGKMQEHRGKETQFAQWVQVLKAHPDQAFALEWDDWLYFFGK